MRQKKLPPDFEVMEAWNELFILLESIDKDLKKTVTKGTKRSGINSRKGLYYAQELIKNIIHGSLQKQKEIRAAKPPHGNRDGKGIQAMKELNKRKRETDSNS
jgi:hypothetical protein